MRHSLTFVLTASMLVGCTMLNPGFDLDADGGATDGEPGPTGEDPTDDGGTTETDEPPDMLPDDTSGGEECGNGIVEGDELCDDAQLPNGTCLNCAEVECAKGFENCNAVAEDGCEVDLFSTAHSCGYCGHDCLGGACEDGMCQPYLLAEAQGAPYDLIVDDKNAYWVNRSFNTVMQTAKDGGGPVEQVAGGQNGPTGITEHAGKLYWADFYDGEIVRGALGDQIGPFAQAQSNPFSITNDAERVCWTNFGNGSIACKTLDGNIAGTLTTGQPQPWGITSLPGELFWSTAAAEGSIQYLPEGDVEPTPLAVALGLELGGLSTDGEWLYFAVPNPGYVAKVPLGGDDVEPTIVAANEPKPKDVVFDDEYVYWTTVDGGEVAFKSRSGGGVMILAWSPGSAWAIDQDQVAVYWTDLIDDTVWAVAKP